MAIGENANNVTKKHPLSCHISTLYSARFPAWHNFIDVFHPFSQPLKEPDQWNKPDSNTQNHWQSEKHIINRALVQLDVKQLPHTTPKSLQP